MKTQPQTQTKPQSKPRTSRVKTHWNHSTSTVYLDASRRSWIIQGMLPEKVIPSFESLWELHPEQVGQIRFMGKLVNTPRWSQSYMTDYKYSGTLHKGVDLPEVLKNLLEFANTFAGQQFEFNQCLVNWYQNGHHYIAPHADDERELIKRAPIFSASLGQARTFRIRDKQTKRIVMDIPMSHGSFIVMGGDMQSKFLHEVPKVTGNKGQALGRRINVTFRTGNRGSP